MCLRIDSRRRTINDICNIPLQDSPRYFREVRESLQCGIARQVRPRALFSSSFPTFVHVLEIPRARYSPSS